MSYVLSACRAALAITMGAAFIASAAAQTPAAAPVKSFTLTSPVHKDGAFLEKKYSGPCFGDNVSLPLAWDNPPAGTKSFGIILFDYDSNKGLGTVHWVAYGIAPDATSLAEGEATNASPRITGGSNMRQMATYYGPCANAADAPHHYLFTIYALDMAKADLPTGLTRDQFLEKTKGKVLGATSLVATFRRPN